MTIILAIIAGTGLGYIFERGDFCFHSAWRRLAQKPRQLDLFRAYLLTMLIAIPLVQGMKALGWIDPWIPPFAWQANIFGGLIFGVGMVVAASCITGLFYKLGHGMAGVLVGLTFWALGDILTYLGPLKSLREALRTNTIEVNGQSATVTNLFGPAGWLILAVLAVAAIIYLARSPVNGRNPLWNWLTLGIATGLFMSFAWLLARQGGSNYTYGTSGVPSGIVQALTGQGSSGSIWIPLTLIMLVPGALIAAKHSGTFWLRGETTRRYVELGAGGLLMGVGAGIAGGCNLGHSLVGVPLLSMGSITSTIAMAAGVIITTTAVRLWQSRQQTAASPQTA
ncbi:MAG: YeeE/YedE family protein [Chloroflexi bacterium]|nr:YeeE/YedE family protein [Chloroflexota bacterium]